MTDPDGGGLRVHMRFGGRDRSLFVPQVRLDQGRRILFIVSRAPFQARAWRELVFYLLSSALAAAAMAFIFVTMGVGAGTAVTFLGLFIVGASVRGARGVASWHRGLARSLLGEVIADPEAFLARPGILGWLQAALRDRAGWRAIAYSFLKIPLALFGLWFAFGTWYEAFSCLTFPLFRRGDSGPGEFGLIRYLFSPAYFSVGSGGFWHGLAIFVTGIFLLFLAPWTVRVVVFVDRVMMRVLLGPDPVTARLRTLEQARARTVDVSAATLRKIERDLHDGTQAQLVALAMRLGQAKEKLAAAGDVDLAHVRRLVDEAHSGAKEAIVELRDLARGIHPPVLDVGLEGALSTLAARSTLPTELAFAVTDRPTPAIEAIAYFCVAELLANIAQHAHASRASVTCSQFGRWVRIVVRDDGRGGARPALIGSSSSGLAGLAERVRAVDGHLDIDSPPGGPTVATVDLPLQA